MRSRWLYFTNLLQQDRWDIPPYEYSEEWELAQEIATIKAEGFDGAYDLYGVGRSPILEREITLNFNIVGNSASEVEAKVKEMIESTTKSIRMLWRGEPNNPNSLKWTFARVQNISLGRERSHVLIQPVSMTVMQVDPLLYKGNTSAWLSANGYTVHNQDPFAIPDRLLGFNSFAKYTITTSPTTITIIHDGNFFSRRIIFFVKVLGTNGANNLTITNTTTSQAFTFNLTSTTSNHQIIMNCSPGVTRGLLSQDSGISWTYFDPSLGALQAVPMELAPNTMNELSISTSQPPNFELYIWWQHAYLW